MPTQQFLPLAIGDGLGTHDYRKTSSWLSRGPKGAQAITYVKIAEWTLKLAEHALFSSFGCEIIQNDLIISSVTKGPFQAPKPHS